MVDGDSEDCGASLSGSLEYEEEQLDEYDNEQGVLRSIVVGYAFGPKKMSTMGVVMAEASKARLSTTISSFPTVDMTVLTADEKFSPLRDASRRFWTGKSEGTKNKDIPVSSLYSLDDSQGEGGDEMAGSSSLSSQALQSSFQQSAPDRVLFTVDKGVMSSSSENPGISTIVRFFRSSCSSVDEGSLSTGTGTHTASSTAGTATTNHATMSSSSSSARRQRTCPVRISFVPLNMEAPLEDQHGGQMDVILHKLTEDILCLSQLSIKWPNLQKLTDYQSIEALEREIEKNQELEESSKSAILRVYRLCQFQRSNPNCYMVDDPVNVQTLMSRSDIAKTLNQCLKGVYSTSGIPVGCPKSIVVSDNGMPSTSVLEEAGIDFPVIAKPLIAAGTKSSHAMSIILNPDSFPQAASLPCLCQEYCNHDAILYKVYVLGDHVSVHRRRSLPSLPTDQESRTGFLKFDSQRPYPRLSDFEFESMNGSCSPPQDCSDMQANEYSHPKTPTKESRASMHRIISAEEMKPIVRALKSAFGLELFGFDVLIAHKSFDEPQMLVVDVNYFPSYKEVPHFPALLARHLTDRAVQSRENLDCATPHE